MTFTEVVFEVGDPRHPLCRLTRQREGAYGVYRIMDTGQASRRFRAHITFHGPEDACAELPRDLRALRQDDHVEVLYEGAGTTALVVETPIAPDVPCAGFVVMPGLLQAFGVDTLLEPFLVTEGRIRVRLVVPRHLETQDALRTLQEVQRTCGFPEFRILRVGSVEAALHLDLVRRILPPEQEDLLGLAASMGYYATPKGVTLEQIASDVGLSISPVHKRLKAAEESLVALHVHPVDVGPQRRRVRRDLQRVEPDGPREVTMRVRAPRLGPSDFTQRHPGSRALLQALSEDRETRTATVLAVLVAPSDAQQEYLQQLQTRQDIVAVQSVARDHAHASLRVAVREGGGYGFAWWTDVWGHEALLRPILFDGPDVALRFTLLRPHTQERFLSRIAECAKAGGWLEHEVLSVRPVRPARTAPIPPEPLTPRQLEVLRIAHALGYYRTPRKCTLEQVATTLGVSANAVHKNLVLAESKLINAYLAAGL